MDKSVVLHKGKVKTVFSTDKPDEVLIQYEDKVTAGNGEKEDYPEGKGPICCEISAIIFKELEEAGIKTHYIDMPTYRAMWCKEVEIIPIEVVVRNIAAGSIVRQTTLEEGMIINWPLVEYYLKDDEKNDPLLTEDRVRLMGYENILKDLEYNARAVNATLRRIFSEIGLTLVDFKLEFGFDSNQNLLLADEISPDSCRLWKIGTKESYDKDLFRNETGDLINAYKGILLDLQGTYNE